MIYLCSHLWANKEDRENCLKVLSFLEIPLDRYVFVDLNYESVDIKKANVIICFDRAYKDIARLYTADGVFKIKDMVGRDMIDESSKFMLFNIAHTMTQIMTSEDTKQKVWNKLLMFEEYYLKMYPIDLEQSDESEEEVVETESETLPEAQPHVEYHDEDTEIPVIVNVQEFVNELAQHIDLTDPSIGKTLSLANKIVFATPEGNVTIHPVGGRIPKDNTAHLSIKDTIALLKTCLMFNATTVSFYLKDS